MGQIILIGKPYKKDFGVAAFKRLDQGTAELKRLYISESDWSEYQVKELVGEVVKSAKEMGYSSISAHFIPAMKKLIDICTELRIYTLSCLSI